ncbi:hypothetical protein ColLi_09108 [Colletotrichum liriopes]|uniref:Uncharacterized protein n=1 Tax=Colletotrichum liriopes TaxID=708192 RepID=A0AA37GSB5_9PEZI|nr:hypothetical protein ColLi_09108 [Colletotrichum liriopes]
MPAPLPTVRQNVLLYSTAATSTVTPPQSLLQAPATTTASNDEEKSGTEPISGSHGTWQQKPCERRSRFVGKS